MGTYLSQPNRDKNCEEGEDLRGEPPASWGVVDMQGWRKTMEDAHFASSNVRPPGVSIGDDRNNASTAHRPGDDLKASKTMVFAVFDGHGGPEVARFCQLYLLHVLTKQEAWTSPYPDVGRALISCFHEMDRMIEDPLRRDEIMNLKTEKPEVGEYRAIATAPQEKFSDNDLTGDSFADEKKIDIAKSLDSTDSDSMMSTHALENGVSQHSESLAENDHYQECFSDEIPPQEDSNMVDKDVDRDDVRVGNNSVDEQVCDEVDEDDSCDILNEDVGEHAVALFKQLLYIDSSSPQEKGIVHFDPRSTGDGSRQELATSEVTKTTTTPERDTSDGRSVFQPTLIINGKQTCNLPEHPIHAGCTAICAVIVGKILTVANAGDSRAVLCRGGGIVEPLSFDHKPTQDREMNRILAAGGFVNQFGRVNGNLNLSRSIGDLKYKQVPGIPPWGQMITAEPDITQFQLDDRDEFIILGCDGIWDCLTNEEAVAYVRQRIDFKTPIEIGIEMLDAIVSVDPRTTQGIGGDNMTIMIIDLMPYKRSYYINTLVKN